MASVEIPKETNGVRRRFSKREWWLTIIVVVIAEYMFLDKVFKYGNNEGIVSYVSFAGTIVSIILAVLAIVYSYYQNFSQQRDSSNIATQIDLLRRTVVDVRVSKNEFTSELQRINDISNKLDQSLSILAESQTHVSQLSSEFTAFRSLLETSSGSRTQKEDVIVFTRSQVRQILDKQTDATKTSLYALYVSADDDLELEEKYRKYAMEPFTKMVGGEQGLYSLGGGVFTSTLTIFNGLGLIDRLGKKFKFNSDLEDFIKELIESEENLKTDIAKESIKSIKEKVQSRDTPETAA